MATVSVKRSVVHDQKSLSTFLEGLSITWGTCTYRTTHISYTTCMQCTGQMVTVTLPYIRFKNCSQTLTKWVTQVTLNTWMSCDIFKTHYSTYIFLCLTFQVFFTRKKKKARSFWIGNRVLVSLTVLLMTRKQPTKVLLTGYDIVSEKFRANNNNK